MSSHTGYVSISKSSFWAWDLILAILVFVPGSKYFLYFGAMCQKPKKERIYWVVHDYYIDNNNN